MENNRPMNKDILDRFFSKIFASSNGCWIWKASKTTGGYPNFWSSGDGYKYGGHKWSYEYFIGPVPPRLELHHMCETRACVNPTHLIPINDADHVRINRNHISKVVSSRTICKNGHERNEENTYHVNEKFRRCRVCNALAARKYRDNKSKPKEKI